MVTTKKSLDLLLLLILAVFPFGQLPGIFLESLFKSSIRLHPLDFLVGAYVILALLSTKNNSKLRPLLPLIVVFGFSLIMSVFINMATLVGILYFVRLVFYLAFVYLVKARFKPVMLVAIGLAVALFGFVQYFIFPDLTSLKLFGWDDHYFRLTSTFLDPAFTGAILALTALLAIYVFQKTKNRLYVIYFVVLAVALAFTYSRASYLAFLIGLLILLFRKKKLLFASAIFFILVVFILPKNVGGEGVKLTRTSSIALKLENYSQSLELISKYPLFGVGYNNICKAKEVLSFETEKQENSCGGLDNSFLFIVATTGAMGLFIFIRTLSDLFRGKLLYAALAVLIVHSLFTNTLVYPWVLVYLALLRSSEHK